MYIIDEKKIILTQPPSQDILKLSTSQVADKFHIISDILSLCLLRLEFPPVASVLSFFGD